MWFIALLILLTNSNWKPPKAGFTNSWSLTQNYYIMTFPWPILKSQIYISEITRISSFLANSSEFCKYFWNFLKPGMSESRTSEVCRSQEFLETFLGSKILSWIAGIRNSDAIVRILTKKHNENLFSWNFTAIWCTVADYRPFTVWLQVKTLLPCILLLTPEILL